MDWTHLHLILNHLPVIGSALGFLVLSWGMLRGYDEVKKVGLAILIFAALVAVPVYLTGEPAEETVENLPGVSEQIIGQHEDSALYSLIAVIATGVVALAGLILFQIKVEFARILLFTSLVFSLITGGLMAYTANLGGQIRHTEIRGAAQTTVPANETPKAEKEKDDDR